jgi:hypothetical protein
MPNESPSHFGDGIDPELDDTQTDRAEIVQDFADEDADLALRLPMEEDPMVLMPPPKAWDSDAISPTEPLTTLPRTQDEDLAEIAAVDEVASDEPYDIDTNTETSSHSIMVELKRIEDEVRRILEIKDPKRKRKLTGTRRWLELEEDLVAWRFSERMDEASIARLRQLVARRHSLFGRLRFLAGTRPTWNT